MSKTVFKKGSCAVVIIVLNCCVNHFTNNLIGPCSISKSIYNHMTRCQRSANNKSTLPEQLLWDQKLPELAQLLNCHLAKFSAKIFNTFLSYNTVRSLCLKSRNHSFWRFWRNCHGYLAFCLIPVLICATKFDNLFKIGAS